MNADREYLLKLQSSIFPKNHNQEYFLKEWQRITEGLLPENITFTSSDFCKSYDISMEQFENLTGPSFKDLINHKQLIEPFLQSLDQESYDRLNNVIVGTLPKRSIDAETFTGPFGTPLIIFHDGLIWLIDHFKWIQAFRKEQNYSPVSRKYYMEELQKLQFFFLQDGKLDITLTRGRLSEENFLKSTIQVQFLKLFIFAHEYAHIYLNHLEEVADRQIVVDPSIEPIEFKNYNISEIMEFDADALAYKWYQAFLQSDANLVKAANERNQHLLILPLELLYVFNLFQAPKLLLEKSSSVKTHPPTIERFTRLYNIIKKDLTPEEILRVEEMFGEAKKQIDIFINAKNVINNQ